MIDEDAMVELKGLQHMVDLYWGGKSPTLKDSIRRAKAMLENSEWGKKYITRINLQKDNHNND